MEETNGIIFEFEGTDGSGKQTQTELLLARLQEEYKGKREITKQDFPNYKSESAGPVNMYLHGDLADHANDLDAYQISPLYAADRFCTYAKKGGFGEIYKNGGIVILDRYTGSNLIHQACKIEDIKERDTFLNWAQSLEFDYMKLPKPTVVIFLDMPVEASKKLREGRALKAGKKDNNEQDEMHMYKAYNAGKYGAEKCSCITVSCVDEKNNIKTVQQIHEEIYKLVKKYI